MSVGHYYELCNRYKGRAVEIKTHDGRVHRGIIRNVDNRNVFLQPLGRPRNLGGFGYGAFGPGYGYGAGYGPGYGYGGGFGYGVALGAIGTLALLPLFFW
ncbi:hypothetical protein [Bacillus piscicola]|uniref:hypothetical protein n=1 Tax=Bacillus piscicola TaxID=1632684 RepID=UPI001F097769|nr:hypothetical protein [Bacillus piscicola]